MTATLRPAFLGIVLALGLVMLLLFLRPFFFLIG